MTWRVELAGTTRHSVIEGGPGALAGVQQGAAHLAEAGRRCYLMTDANVEGFWGERFEEVIGKALAGTLVLQPGELSKSLNVYGRALEALAAAECRRDDVVAALGGGVVGDLAGFVAATYHRGVEFWQVPTSLLAQVDSSVGGKVAVNLRTGKNLVGAFYQPDRVFIDPELLSTLPREEVINGLGEVVKYGLLAGEPLLAEIEERAPLLLETDAEATAEIVQRCVEYKARIVQEDERESGLRAVLNLGHTTAHALEALAGYEGISHGRAVGVGLLVSLDVGKRLFGLPAELGDRVRRLLQALELPITAAVDDPGAVLRAMATDKKATSAGRGFVTLRAPGEPVWGVDVPEEVLVSSLEAVAA